MKPNKKDRIFLAERLKLEKTTREILFRADCIALLGNYRQMLLADDRVVLN